MNKVV